MSKRIINFSAGPSTLPLSILENAQKDLVNWQGSGLSVMEMSHRSKEFLSIRNKAEETLRKIAEIPDDYDVLFLQGGASLQFSMIPINLCQNNQSVDLINTGSWTKKALKEIKKIARTNIVASSEDQNFLQLPILNGITFSKDAAFTYMCSNNTIFGTQFKEFPKTDAPLVVDMSSDILSRKLNIKEFDLIFAGAQKNIGPSGVAIVIIKKTLLERCPKDAPSMLQYRIHSENDSLYNTPPTFGIYMAGLMFEWIEQQGGLEAIETKNNEKAALLYNEIESNNLFYSPISKADRSTMNVVFRVEGDREDLEKLFVEEAKAEGLVELKGHRSVGGLRASIYNAQSIENVQCLVDFMNKFSKKYS